jgi:SH3 domain protein
MFIIQKHKPTTALTRFSPLLRLIFISALSFLAYASTAAADTYSVSNESEVPVRSGQGTEYKIVSLLQNGEAVVSLEENGYWIKVRTATGREGWMLKRYLSTTPSSIADALTPLPTTEKQASEEAEKSSPVDEQPLNPLQPGVNLLSENIQPQKLESSPPPIEQKPRERDHEIAELRDKLAEATRENKVLREAERIKWFLAGGGVLIIGWLIGLITCKSRRRKPSLL